MWSRNFLPLWSMTAPLVFSGVRVARSLFSFRFNVFIVCPFVFFFWPLYCRSFFDFRLLIIPLISSNLSSSKIYVTLADCLLSL